VHHPVITDERSLLWVTNQNTITQHVWISRVPDLYYPDICVFDLDPSKDDPASVRAAALGLRESLDELGLPSWIKTTGGKGFHIVVPLDGKSNMSEVAALPTPSAASSSRTRPEHLTQEFSKVDRKGRIYVDTGRNGYSARSRRRIPFAQAGAPVSAPCTVGRVEKGKVDPDTFTFATWRRASRRPATCGPTAAQASVAQETHRETEAHGKLCALSHRHGSANSATRVDSRRRENVEAIKAWDRALLLRTLWDQRISDADHARRSAALDRAHAIWFAAGSRSTRLVPVSAFDPFPFRC
jgi:DNA primase